MLNTQGFLDIPGPESELRGDVLTVMGWCLFDGSTVSHVEVVVNGVVVGRARAFVERGDIGDVFPNRDAPVAGFQLLVPIEDWAPDASLNVSVVATSLDGRRWYSNSNRVLRVGDGSTRTDASQARHLEDRRKIMLARLSPPRERRRVAVVTHDLNYGGGQLWLSEMLRQFQELDLFEFDVVTFVDGPLRQSLEESGVFVHVTPQAAIHAVGAHSGRVTEFAVLLRALNADAVLVNTVLPFQAVEAAHDIDLPVLWAIHESFPLSVYCHILWGGSVHRYVQERFAAAFGLASGLIFEAEPTAQLFSRLSLPSRRHVVDYGVDIAAIDAYRAQFDRNAARQRHGWTDDDVVMVVVGIFEGRKAQAAIVAAFDELAALHPHVHLAMVGGHASAYYHAVAEQVRRLDQPDRVQLISVTPDIYEWYALADILVCGSDIESLPRSILEAMAFELPVLSTDVFGVATLLDDGITGWLTACHDLQGLIATMDRVLRLTPAERSEVGSAARREVERRSGERAYGVVLAEALNALIDDPNANLQQILSDRAPRKAGR